jgi:pSer/pThr/pTyr-binding forkhead associated (FHA) protein
VSAAAAARLVWTRPDGAEVAFALDGAAVEIGRDPDRPVCIDEPLVSRLHARIERRDGAWILCDLDSTNFTRVNGERIRREHELADGDEVHFARARCVFRLDGGGPTPTS